MTVRAPFLLLGVAACLSVAGCGGNAAVSTLASRASAASVSAASQTATDSGSSAAPATSTVPPTSSATATNPAPPIGTAKAALRKIVLQATDLPVGWKSEPADQSDSTDDPEQAALVRCVGGTNTSAHEVAKVESNSYSSGTSSISSSATRYRSKADIAADVALLKRPLVAPCFQALLKRDLAKSPPSGTKIGTVSVHVTPGAGGGPANVAATLVATITLTASGRTVVLFENVAFITGPLIEAQVDFSALAKPVPQALRTKLIAVVAGRAAHA